MRYNRIPANGEPKSDRQAQSILVVDADCGTRLYIKVILMQNGYEVVEAADIDSALAAFTDARPDLSIVDLATADAGGLDLSKLLHNRSEACHHPVLVLANRNRPESATRGLAAGAARYLYKPVLSGNLLADVRQLLASGGNRRAGDKRGESGAFFPSSYESGE
jgi:DNA-binding response OmpR family regulator